MKKLIKILALSSLYLLSACGGKTVSVSDADSVQILSIPVSLLSSENTKLSSIPLKSRLIWLNTDSVIGEINKIIRYKSSLFLSDASALYEFNQKGDLLSVISDSGQGPDQYNSITDFSILPSGDILILNKATKRIFQYTSNKELRRILPLQDWISSLTSLSDDEVYVYTGNLKTNSAKRIHKLSLNTGAVSESYLPLDERKSKYLHTMFSNNFTNLTDKTLLFSEVFNDTIYSLSNGEVTPDYILDFQGKNIPDEFYSGDFENIMFFFQGLFKQDYVYSSGTFGIGEKFIASSSISNKLPYMSFFPKQNISKPILVSGIKDDINLEGYEFSIGDSQFFKTDGALYFNVPTEMLSDHLSDKFIKDLHPDISKDIDSKTLLLVLEL